MIFLDYQNVYLGAHRRFQPSGAARKRSHVDPRRIGELLVGRRPWPSELVYRGRPNPSRQPVSAIAFDRQAEAWSATGVTVISRPLRYPADWPSTPAQEKGVDVALAIDYVRLAMLEEYDVGILFSLDTDLLPALETIANLNLARVEVATWSKMRLRFPNSGLPWCHYLSVADYRSVLDPTDYTVPTPPPIIGERTASSELVVIT